MKRPLITTSIILFSLACVYSQVTPLGAETQVNTSIVNSQQNPALAMEANGNYVVVWESLNQDGSGYGIYAQRFDNTGNPLGSETQINATTNNDQRFPSIAIDNNGNFTIVWQGLSQSGGDGWDIYLRRYDNTGTDLSGEVRVNTTTAGQQRFPDIAMDDDGDFVVVWESDFDIYLQRYNNSGVAQASEILVNPTTADVQNYPAIAMDSDGDFVVSWQSLGQDGDAYGVYAQSFNPDGSVALSEFLVNTNTSNNQLNPDIAIDANGNFVICWVSNLQDGSQEGIYAQRFNNTATPLGTEFLVNSRTTGVQDHPNINMTTNGLFIISWNDYGQDGDRFGVYFASYDADGNVIDGETLVNTNTTHFQQFSAIGLDLNTTATIVWQDGDRELNNSLDTDDYAIAKQRYQVALPPTPVELLYFTATATAEQTSLLQWETSSEVDNQGFYIEHSPNGISWETLGFVKGAGTTQGSNSYRYVDKKPIQGINYYRLKQVDFDGLYEYSIVRSVQLEFTQVSLKIFPNPTTDLIFIDLKEISEQILSLSLFNSSGQMLWEKTTIDASISVKNLASGNYLLVLETNQGVYQRSIVKE